MRVDAARNHERIVVAAGAAFEEDGPGVALDEVARRAGVAPATLYRRFRNRDQLVRAVVEHVLATEVAPAAEVVTDDPWDDLVGMLGAVVDSLAAHRTVLRLAREVRAVDVDLVGAWVAAMERPLRRAIDAGRARPELLGRDLAAVVVMALATVHERDPAGADRRRYLALLVDGLRPAPAPLPPPSERTLGER
ncbi:TetR/AcrR family transcriptional regulator [Pseudonocardia broussonetiae]|uniref:TetR/AcrR family transcriptional regulator n=2 Tax=Pseudonocardia broussonetiae TaxID=2736640 RepID=A0A6M6JX17_9PSEU|nr:TetR/AcrR family transcriptional regulator [Pseudonocardia broussonetiae]